jgi:hypothetical protein
VVPACRSQEIVVKIGQLRMDKALTLVRISKEMVDSINKVLDVCKALAACRLNSENTVVTFQEYALYYKVDNV